MSTINSYLELFDLPDRSVVQDADGRVWCAQWNMRCNEMWLSPFSDEYAFMIRRDGGNYALGDTPTLPIENLGITDAVGG